MKKMMLTNVPAVTISASIESALRALEAGGAGICLVTDGTGRLKGIVTDGDIRRTILAGVPLHARIAPHMNRRFLSVGPEVSRAHVLDLMRARTIGEIPIVDGSGRVLGLHLLREIVGRDPLPHWAVIMAGGRGERLKPITDHLPKPMIRVAGRPILERIVLHLVGHGIRTIYLSVNYKSHIIEEHFGNGREFGCSITYLKEKEPLGTGGPLALLPRKPDHPLLVLNGDLVTQVNVGEMLERHARDGNRITVGAHEHYYTVPFGVLKEKRGRVLEVREKPTASWLVNAGIYVLDPALLRRIPKGREFPLPALIEDALERKERVGVYRIEEEWMDIGRPVELKKARGEQ